MYKDLNHLSDTEIEALMQRYYSGEAVTKLLKEYQLSIRTAELYKLFPPEVCEDDICEYCEEYFDGPDPIGKTHIREGVVARIVNKPNISVYKHKNHSFKVLEGIVKETADAPDMEEADGLEEIIVTTNLI